LDTIYVYLYQIEELRNWGIEGLKDKINNLKQIEFLQFLNPKIPELDPCPIFMHFRDVQRFTAIFSN
jgi:hypothetical protein